MAVHRARISTNAKLQAFTPTMVPLQKSISVGWMENSAIAVSAPEKPSRRQNSQAEKAIERYRIVYTIPDSVSVGVKKNGLSRVPYQPPLTVWDDVASDPTSATAKHATTNVGGPAQSAGSPCSRADTST